MSPRYYTQPAAPMYGPPPTQVVYVQQAPPRPRDDDCCNCCGCCGCIACCCDTIKNILCCLCIADICLGCLS